MWHLWCSSLAFCCLVSFSDILLLSARLGLNLDFSCLSLAGAPDSRHLSTTIPSWYHLYTCCPIVKFSAIPLFSLISGLSLYFMWRLHIDIKYSINCIQMTHLYFFSKVCGDYLLSRMDVTSCISYRNFASCMGDSRLLNKVDAYIQEHLLHISEEEEFLKLPRLKVRSRPDRSCS